MTFSKETLFKAILFTASVLVIGCSTESNKKKDIVLNSPYDYEQTGNFQVSTFKVTKSDRASSDSYNFVSQKTFNFEACLVDQLNAAVGQPNLRFVVTDEVGNSEPVVTDRRGCVVWSETPKISYLMDETYFKMVRYIRSENYYKGYVKLEAAFMPWYDDAASLVDLRYNKLPEGSPMDSVSVQGIRGASYKPSNSNVRVNLKSASFKFTGLDYDRYEVTPLLGLRVAHKYQVRLTPSVIRKTIKGTVTPELFNTGAMKAVLVVLREDRNPATQFTNKNIVTSVEFEDDLVYGDLTADVSVPFPNVVDITSRTWALITLVPKQQLEGLPSMSFAGPLAPGLLSSLDLRPVKHDALALHQYFQNQLKTEKQDRAKPFEIFQKLSGFKALDVNAKIPGDLFSSERTLKTEVDFILAKPEGQYAPRSRDLRFVLCSQVFNDTPGSVTSLAAQCRRSPETFLTYRVLKFVDRVNSVKPRPVGLPTVDTLKMSIGISNSDSTSSSAGYNFKAGLSLGNDIMKFGSLGGVKLSVGADYSVGRVVKKDQTTSTSATRDRTVMAEGVSYAMDLTTRKCFVAGATDAVLQRYPNEAKGVYYCAAQTEVKNNHVETYYLLSSKMGLDGSPITDNASNSSSPWRVMVRGTQTLNLFAQLLDNPLYQLVLQKIDTEDQTFNKFHELYVNQDFPGVLSE